MKNWKTTAAGIVAAVGTYLATNEDATIQAIGHVLTVLGTLVLGHAAADAPKKL